MNSGWTYRVAKRTADIAFAATGLAVTWPLIGAAALAVITDSPGPALYRSRRMGLGGREFDLLKLRTMRAAPAAAPLVTAASDNRITRVGRWLRRTKIDELPQLLNVVAGDLSLVGPRPEVKRYADKYPHEYSEILGVRPGITDRATLQFVDEEQLLASQSNPEEYYVTSVLPQKIDLYLRYVRNPSLVEDASILLSTAAKLARRLVPG